MMRFNESTEKGLAILLEEDLIAKETRLNSLIVTSMTMLGIVTTS